MFTRSGSTKGLNKETRENSFEKRKEIESGKEGLVNKLDEYLGGPVQEEQPLERTKEEPKMQHAPASPLEHLMDQFQEFFRKQN